MTTANWLGLAMIAVPILGALYASLRQHLDSRGSLKYAAIFVGAAVYFALAVKLLAP